MRVIVVGGPKAGKTTWSLEFKQQNPIYELIHGDDYISLGWSGALQHLVGMLTDRPGDWVAEGVSMVLVVQKMLQAQADARPCDRIVWFHGARQTLDKQGQRTMAESIYQSMSKLYWPLRNMGIEIEEIVC